MKFRNTDGKGQKEHELEHYYEKRKISSFLNVEGMFERAEMAAKAGAKTSSTLKDSGIVVTRFTARNDSRIFIETKCIREKDKLIITYMVSCQGIPKDGITDRREALDYLKEIGGYKIMTPGPQIEAKKRKPKMTIEKLQSLKNNRGSHISINGSDHDKEEAHASNKPRHYREATISQKPTFSGKKIKWPR